MHAFGGGPRPLAQRGKEHNLPDGASAGQHHHQPVDADADPARRGHARLERLDERLVVGMGVLVAGRGGRALLLEAAPLLVGVVQLGERVRDLHAVGERLPALDEAVFRAVALGERRELDGVVQQERRRDELGLHVLGEQVVDELRPRLLPGHLEPALAQRPLERLERAVRVDVDARPLRDRASERLARPRRLETVLAQPARDEVHELLGVARDVLVVRVGLVPLEHRELGVVLERQPLVAEVLADLVHALQAADDQPLEVELDRDAEVEVALQRVVVRREGPRDAAAVDRLEHGRLALDEAARVEERAHRGDDLRARHEELARLFVGDEVELAMAEASLDVREPVVLLGRRAQRLGQQLVGLEPERELAAAAAEDRAVGADQVAEVEGQQAGERLARAHVDARVQLEPARAVDEVEERGLALPAARGEAAGDAHAIVGLLPRREVLVRRLDVGDGADAREGVRERVDALLAQRLELAPPDGEQLRGLLVRHYATSILVILSLRALPLGSCTVTSSLRLWPTRALPTRDSLESLFSAGFAPVEPTIVYLSDLPDDSSLTLTSEPTRTTSLSSSEESITEAERSLSSSEAMRASSIACSFLASSYSEFSEMSPKSRASLMRSATSRRLAVERCSISFLRFSRPSGVRMTSFCIPVAVLRCGGVRRLGSRAAEHGSAGNEESRPVARVLLRPGARPAWRPARRAARGTRDG